jgi:hypothetical protein
VGDACYLLVANWADLLKSGLFDVIRSHAVLINGAMTANW